MISPLDLGCHLNGINFKLNLLPVFVAALRAMRYKPLSKIPVTV